MAHIIPVRVVLFDIDESPRSDLAAPSYVISHRKRDRIEEMLMRPKGFKTAQRIFQHIKYTYPRKSHHSLCQMVLVYYHRQTTII